MMLSSSLNEENLLLFCAPSGLMFIRMNSMILPKSMDQDASHLSKACPWNSNSVCTELAVALQLAQPDIFSADSCKTGEQYDRCDVSRKQHYAKLHSIFFKKSVSVFPNATWFYPAAQNVRRQLYRTRIILVIVRQLCESETILVKWITVRLSQAKP
ncbi:hypothetical protein T4E_12151 [Trichinella pseudospiralis]|uniref:Uncharacterized protein n=1 Tax=Trichinella pseudospiralis TaxID=6337 RepID=A0A0V0XGN8_TRIPS|nr:hypothetical protein T4E_12151 [Trichinella pseudospiralis]